MTNVSIGTHPHEIPINQLLGKQAFQDRPAVEPCAIMHQLHDDTSSSTNGGRVTQFGHSSWEHVKMGLVMYDNYGAYEKSTGQYTAPRTGIYLCHIGANVYIKDVRDNSGTVIQFYVQLNGSDYKQSYFNKDFIQNPEPSSNNHWVYMEVNTYVPCRKGDIVRFVTKNNSSGGEHYIDDDDNGTYSEMVFRMV